MQDHEASIAVYFRDLNTPGAVTNGDTKWTTGSWLASRGETNGESKPTGKGWARRRRKQCERRLKRGKRTGVHAMLRANASQPALPSILLPNISSLENRLDYIRLQQTTQQDIKDCCAYIFTDTWLSDRVPDASIQLDGLALHRTDRDLTLCPQNPRWRAVCLHQHGLVQ